MNIEIKVVHLALFYDEYKYISITIFLNRPLIGVNFCKRLEKADGADIYQVCFRPLIGVNFCKLINVYINGRKRDDVSVPLSGLISVNIIKGFRK